MKSTFKILALALSLIATQSLFAQKATTIATATNQTATAPQLEKAGDPVTVFVYEDETYVVVAGAQTSKTAMETFSGTVKKGSKVDKNESSAKRSPLPTITTTYPDEPEDNPQARSCRRLGCNTVGCRTCRRLQEQLRKGDSRDLQLN